MKKYTDMSGLTMKNGRLINDRPCGVTGIQQALDLRKMMKREQKIEMMVEADMRASMGSVLLSSGTKGKRSSLIHSKVMTHQVSHGTRGNIQDTRIDQMEGEKYNYILFNIMQII